MSQMPDKLWVHKDTKYNTGDGVYAYQYKFAQDIEDEGIENFVEYVPTDAFIEKACKWLKFNYTEYLNDTRIGIDIDEMVKDFKMDMKGE